MVALIILILRQGNRLINYILLKTYCVPRLLYGCEIWPLETTHIHKLDVIWNNGFRCIFDCCWRDNVKPLEFFCKSLPLSYLIDERQHISFNKLQHTDNPILRTLFHLPTVKYEILGLAAKYGLNGVQGNLSAMKDCVWTCFVQKVRF